MILQIDQTVIPMKLVFQLTEELESDPKRVELTQALTLNQSKPQMGLRGNFGLFGSKDWWANINQKKMPLMFVSGIVNRVYVAGQDSSELNNTVDVVMDDGSVRSAGIYTNDINDVALFRVGSKIELVYALDELKQQPALDGGINYSKIALEMAVSYEVVG